MHCPKCRHPHTRVLHTELSRGGSGKRRRRCCEDCGYRFTTYEQVISDRSSLDRIAAGYVEDAGNIVSGLILDEIGESGHGTANRLWKIAAYLRQRDR